MASRFGSFGSNDSHLDSPVADWHPDFLDLSDTDLFGSGGTYRPRGVLEQFNHSSIPSSYFHLGSSSQGTSLEATRQNTFPPLSDIPGPSSFQHRDFAIAHESDVRNRDADFGGETRMGLWATRDTHLPIVAPALPPTLPLPLAATFPFNWFKVPQRDYDHGRKQRSFKPSEPIPFSVGGRPGVNIGDALGKKFENLDGRDDPVLQDTLGVRISCRLLFSGYPANGSSCQIHTLDWTRERRPITRSKLAHEVARILERYLHDMAKLTPDAPVGRWRIGQGCMKIENFFLVRLFSVSKGSFQPEIWVADPSVSHPFLG